MASAPSTAIDPACRVRQAELARMLGVSRQSLHELVKRGKIPIGADGLIEVGAARAALLEHVHPGGKTASAAAASMPAAPAPAMPAEKSSDDDAAPEGSSVSYHVAKTLRESAEASIAMLKLAEMRGELVRKDDTERAAFEAARTLRDGLINSSKRLGAIVATMTAPAECSAAIERELRALLQTWSKTMGIAASATTSEPAP